MSVSASASNPPRASEGSCDSYETYESRSTTATSAHTSTQASVKEAAKAMVRPVHEDDTSPSISNCSRSSADTFESTLTSDEELERESHINSLEDCPQIPPLPVYTHPIVDPGVCPSTPQEFARLFPSRDRLSIRHDDFTADGNLNLRVDTVLPGRLRRSMQLFHLRMYDLVKRDFSLRRYCRDSGREVCSAKRKFLEVSQKRRPGVTHSVSHALRAFGTHKPSARTDSGGSASTTSSKIVVAKRSASSHFYDDDDEQENQLRRTVSSDATPRQPRARPQPTNVIKLEFSNYARVEVSRHGGKNSKRYEFDWWGQKYQWKRITDKNLSSVSFHLVRDGSTGPIAHIVPETRSPTQIVVDEEAGGWVPPCHMWINDQSIVDAATDVADVVVATGLIALVDDCIKQRWQTKSAKKNHHFGMPLATKTLDFDGARSLLHNIFHRHASDARAPSPAHKRTVSP